MGVHRKCGTAISEAELSIGLVIVWATKHSDMKFGKSLITSVDTDEGLIILLEMSTRKIEARFPGAVPVAEQRTVSDVTRFLLVTWAFPNIGQVEDGSKPS